MEALLNIDPNIKSQLFSKLNDQVRKSLSVGTSDAQIVFLALVDKRGNVTTIASPSNEAVVQEFKDASEAAASFEVPRSPNVLAGAGGAPVARELHPLATTGCSYCFWYQKPDGSIGHVCVK